MDALKKEEMYTIEDIYSLPDGKRAELIDGKIYYMTLPSTKHQTLVMDLSYQIKDYIKHNKGKYFTKLFKYRTAGVKEYWIVDSMKKSVTVYFFEKELVEEYDFGTDIPVGIYERFHIKAE